MDATTDLLECSICTELFGDARFLKCLHTFCVDCLEKMATSNTRYITCPTCRSKTYLSASGVSDLPHNFYVDKMKEALHVKQADSCKEHEQELLEVRTLLTSCQEENERLNVKISANDIEKDSNLLRKELKKGRRKIEVLEAEVTRQKEKDKYIQTLLTEKDKHRNEIEKTKRELNMKKVELKVQVSLCGQVQKQLEELQKEVADSKKQQKTEEFRNLYSNIIQKIENCSRLINNISNKFDQFRELPALLPELSYCCMCSNHKSHCDTTFIKIKFSELSRELNCSMEETNHIKEQFKLIREQFSYIRMIREESNIYENTILLLFSIFVIICIVYIS